jgi:hypothetical protein
MRSTFDRFVCPETNATRALGSRSFSARKAINASFARPSVGGVVSDIFNAPSWTPLIALRFAPGCTRTGSTHPSLESVSSSTLVVFLCQLPHHVLDVVDLDLQLAGQRNQHLLLQFLVVQQPRDGGVIVLSAQLRMA